MQTENTPEYIFDQSPQIVHIDFAPGDNLSVEIDFEVDISTFAFMAGIYNDQNQEVIPFAISTMQTNPGKVALLLTPAQTAPFPNLGLLTWAFSYSVAGDWSDKRTGIIGKLIERLAANE